MTIKLKRLIPISKEGNIRQFYRMQHKLKVDLPMPFFPPDLEAKHSQAPIAPPAPAENGPDSKHSPASRQRSPS